MSTSLPLDGDSELIPASDTAPKPKPASGGATALKPRCALEVAVVGNRRFAGETDAAPNAAAGRMKSQAAEACKEAWRVIAGAMVSALDAEVPWSPAGPPADGAARIAMRDFFSEDRPRLGVLSSLAAGADQIGADTALAVALAQKDVEVELEAVLPFRQEDYPGRPGAPRPEFRPEEAETLGRLADAVRQVVRMDGLYDVPPDSSIDAATAEILRHRAYRDARDLLLQNSDLLVAIYDPFAKGGRAGTLETLERAFDESLPVLAVLVSEDTKGARIALYRTRAERPPKATDEWEGACPLDVQSWRADLGERVRYLLWIPHLAQPKAESPDDRAQRERSLTATVEGLRLFYGEKPLPAVCCQGLWKRFLSAVWQCMIAVSRSQSSRHRYARLLAEPEGKDKVTLPAFAAFYDRASAVSGDFMCIYRGNFVLAFTLASLAVAAAVALLAVAVLAAGRPPLGAVLGLGGLKIGLLALLLWLVSTSRRERFQQHAADFRYLAELLRPMEWLAPLGACVPAVELPAHYAPLDPRQDWTQGPK